MARDRQEIEVKVRKILADQLDIDVGEIKDESDIKLDLHADSLGIVELIMEVEDKLEIEIPDPVAENFVTFKDIIDYIEKN